jgi:predicted component of type VI protein secretion system
MERATGTDARLNELAHGVDELAQRVTSGFQEVDRRFEVLDGCVERVEARLDDLHSTLLRGVLAVTGALMVGLLGVIAAIISAG